MEMNMPANLQEDNQDTSTYNKDGAIELKLEALEQLIDFCQVEDLSKEDITDICEHAEKKYQESGCLTVELVRDLEKACEDREHEGINQEDEEEDQTDEDTVE
jgi:hypothetical protein